MNNGCQKTEIVDEAPRRPGSEVLDVVPPEVLGDIVDVHPLSQQGGLAISSTGIKSGWTPMSSSNGYAATTEAGWMSRAKRGF